MTNPPSRRTALLVAALSGVALLSACGEQPTLYTNSAGSLALSRDDKFLYAVDSDNDMVAVVDTASKSLVTTVKVGRAPERVVVGPDDTIYVSNRGARSVSVIKRGSGTWSEILQLPVGVEPVGLAVAPDNKTLYVVNSTSLDSPETGTLTAIDVKTLQPRWDLAVGQEPRAVTLVAGGRALVTLFKGGDVVTVDLNGPTVMQSNTNLYATANASNLDAISRFPSAPPTFGLGLSTFHPRAMSDAVVTPDGKRAIVSMVWSREDSLANPGGGSGGGDASYGGGPCGTAGVAAAGLATFDASGEATVALADDVGRCGGDDDGTKDFPPTALTSPDAIQTLQGPSVSVMDSTGSWLYVVNRNSNNVAVLPVGNRTPSTSNFNDELPTFRPGAIRSLVPVGAGPNGIALTRDGTKAFVYNAFDHSITTLVQSGSGAEAQVITSGRALQVAQDVLPADAVAGRRLFFSAADTRMTASTTGVACATCHLDGREDGHVWVFADGPRQTPSLAGRMTTATAPFHWNGQFNTLQDFLAETVNVRMGGTGASSEMAAQIAAFIDSQPLPDSPLRAASPTDAQLRGAQAFQKAECNSCHKGAALTDNSFHDVGTLVVSGANPDLGLPNGLNVPSLLGVSRTAPFLHDGSAASLRDRLVASRHSDLHGKMTLLSDGEVNDLLEYLKTL
jgi:YVTN family beta-propeller protein